MDEKEEQDFANQKRELQQRSAVYAAIGRERDYQDAKWGSLQERPKQVGSWLLIMQGELDEAIQAWQKSRGDEKALEEILQVISVGVACLTQHGVVERPFIRSQP